MSDDNNRRLIPGRRRVTVIRALGRFILCFANSVPAPSPTTPNRTSARRDRRGVSGTGVDWRPRDADRTRNSSRTRHAGRGDGREENADKDDGTDSLGPIKHSECATVRRPVISQNGTVADDVRL